MGSCSSSSQTTKNHRRINGLQLPLNLQQIVCWIVLVITALLNFLIVSQIQFEGLKVISFIIFSILYVSHTASHVAALLIDPAEEDLRNRKTSEVPEFDRSLHAHVIENGRCHLCNLYTSNKKTKHCGICNKCVYEFDHHCKWLNNCIGQRNYFAFIGCVTTALFISTFTFALCIADIVLFFEQPQTLSSKAQEFSNCTSSDTTQLIKYCQSSIAFLTFLTFLCTSGIAMACALLHLCCFHIYITFLGISTYEYIMRNSNTKPATVGCCRMNLKRKYCFFKKEDTGKTDVLKHDGSETTKNPSEPSKNETNVPHLMNILIDSELKKAIKIFSPDKNKVHPHHDSTIS